MKFDPDKGVFVEDGDEDSFDTSTLIVGDPDQEITPTMMLQHDGETLVTVWMNTGEVEVHREPEDETMRRAAEVFWEGIQVYGGTLYNRVKELNELLTEVRDLVPGKDVVSGLRAFSRTRKEKLAERIDEVLESNKTFLELDCHRSIFDHGEDQEGSPSEG